MRRWGGEAGRGGREAGWALLREETSINHQLEKSLRQTEGDSEGRGRPGGRQSLRASGGEKEGDMTLEGRIFGAEAGVLLP